MKRGNAMNEQRKMVGWLIWGVLSGCAVAAPVPEAADARIPYAGSVQIRQLPAQQAELTLEGVRFTGTWQEQLCHTPECRGPFRNVIRVERKHVYRGTAELAAQGATQLHCSWVRLHEKLSGTCVAEDGRLFRLVAV